MPPKRKIITVSYEFVFEMITGKDRNDRDAFIFMIQYVDLVYGDLV